MGCRIPALFRALDAVQWTGAISVRLPIHAHPLFGWTEFILLRGFYCVVAAY